ncbi:MAG: hypothetical protein B6247_14765 [Candidatus Parabeggiatoa sp. nov. 2]|nr:MAG: hypothetical protein B6247_14765 [Beggiatoa sp. 4572_84]
MYYFENFKGFTHAKLDLFKPLTILIGPNGSGKSNLIEAIELLSFIARGGSLPEITELGREGQLEIRGGLPSCARNGQDAFSMGIDTKDFSYSVKVQTKPNPKIVTEKLHRLIKKFSTRYRLINQFFLNTTRLEYEATIGLKSVRGFSIHPLFLSLIPN